MSLQLKRTTLHILPTCFLCFDTSVVTSTVYQQLLKPVTVHPTSSENYRACCALIFSQCILLWFLHFQKLLTTMIPTDEEKNKILEAQLANPDIPLGNAEQFLLTLSSISELHARLCVWLFKLDYETIESVSLFTCLRGECNGIISAIESKAN